MDSKKIYKVLKALSIVLICFAPLLPLIDIKAKFYFDWNNNVWAIGYFGEYFRQHFSFPGVFNTHELVGWVSPVFYGPGLYSVAGVLSSLVNASAAIRIVIILLTFLQYFCVWRLFVDKGKPWWVPHFCAILLTWSIYPVTNLFNRSALTEYYAVILLNIGIFAWFVSLEEERIKYAWVLLSSLCLATAAYSHPITAMFGALFFLPILIWSVFTFSNKSEVLKATCLLGFGSLLITSPWIYATYKFKSLLQITTQNSGVGFFPGVDTLWSRLAPIPWDGRTMDPYATPHLDTQINLSILLFIFLLIVNMLKNKKPQKVERDKYFFLFCLCSLLSLTFFALSIERDLWKIVPKVFHLIQFASRLVSYINLGAILILFSLLSKKRRLFFQGSLLKVGCIGILLMSFCDVVIKYDHSVHTFKHELLKGLISRQPFQLLFIPYGGGNVAYATPSLFEPLGDIDKLKKVSVFIPVEDEERKFGETKNVHFQTSQRSLIKTNVFAFPWNQILVNSKPIDTALYLNKDFSLSFIAEPASYDLKYSFNPPRIWKFLNALSYITLFGFLCGLIYCVMLGQYRYFRRAKVRNIKSA